MADETVKQEQKHITLIVKNQVGEEVQFKVKLNTVFEKVFKAYSDKKGVQNTKFLFDGHRIKATDTPADLDMEDGDIIDAMLEQLGGSQRLSQ